jgi:hypothetical protein
MASPTGRYLLHFDNTGVPAPPLQSATFANSQSVMDGLNHLECTRTGRYTRAEDSIFTRCQHDSEGMERVASSFVVPPDTDDVSSPFGIGGEELDPDLKSLFFDGSPDQAVGQGTTFCKCTEVVRGKWSCQIEALIRCGSPGNRKIDCQHLMAEWKANSFMLTKIDSVEQSFVLERLLTPYRTIFTGRQGTDRFLLCNGTECLQMGGASVEKTKKGTGLWIPSSFVLWFACSPLVPPDTDDVSSPFGIGGEELDPDLKSLFFDGSPDQAVGQGTTFCKCTEVVRGKWSCQIEALIRCGSPGNRKIDCQHLMAEWKANSFMLTKIDAVEQSFVLERLLTPYRTIFTGRQGTDRFLLCNGTECLQMGGASVEQSEKGTGLWIPSSFVLWFACSPHRWC